MLATHYVFESPLFNPIHFLELGLNSGCVSSSTRRTERAVFVFEEVLNVFERTVVDFATALSWSAFVPFGFKFFEMVLANIASGTVLGQCATFVCLQMLTGYSDRPKTHPTEIFV